MTQSIPTRISFDLFRQMSFGVQFERHYLTVDYAKSTVKEALMKHAAEQGLTAVSYVYIPGLGAKSRAVLVDQKSKTVMVWEH